MGRAQRHCSVSTVVPLPRLSVSLRAAICTPYTSGWPRRKHRGGKRNTRPSETVPAICRAEVSPAGMDSRNAGSRSYLPVKITVLRSHVLCKNEQRRVADCACLNAKLLVPANPSPIWILFTKRWLVGVFSLRWIFYGASSKSSYVRNPSHLLLLLHRTVCLKKIYLVTPMDIASSPSRFNRLVQSIFADYKDFCQTYFDDLSVYTASDSVEDHLTAPEKVLVRCEEQELYAKIEKCVFCATEIPCLGDYIGREGVRMDPSKADTIRNWPQPQTKRDLRSFLGTCVYVMRFCDGFSELIAPLTERIKNKRPRDPIDLSPTDLEAFSSSSQSLHRLLFTLIQISHVHFMSAPTLPTLLLEATCSKWTQGTTSTSSRSVVASCRGQNSYILPAKIIACRSVRYANMENLSYRSTILYQYRPPYNRKPSPAADVLK